MYEWVYPAGSLRMKGPAPNGSSRARQAEFDARTASRMGGLEVRLVYAVIYDDVRLGEAWDDSHLIHTKAYENYRRLTAHMPKGTDLVSAVPPVNDECPDPDPNLPPPPPYHVKRSYWYRLRDHLGYWMPGTWVNERFPNGVPQGFRVSAVGDYATTSVSQPWNGPDVGRLNKPDIIGLPVAGEWPFAQHPNNPWPIPKYGDHIPRSIGQGRGTWS